MRPGSSRVSPTVSDFSVTRDGGYIVSSKINTWIALAPYFVPIYSVFVIIVYGIVSAFFQPEMPSG